LRLDLIVGPNGAGKSTFARHHLLPAVPGSVFVNADEIAKKRWPGQEEIHAYEAAKIAEATRSSLIEARVAFVAETVFSHPSKLDLIRQAKAAGYTVALHALLVPLEISVARVPQRVAEGGHSVPTKKIIERYARVWPLVVQALALVDTAVVYDSSRRNANPTPVLRTHQGLAIGPVTWPKWTPADLASAYPPAR
jgi:predicted ABC-type ATPase